MLRYQLQLQLHLEIYWQHQILHYQNLHQLQQRRQRLLLRMRHWILQTKVGVVWPFLLQKHVQMRRQMRMHLLMQLHLLMQQHLIQLPQNLQIPQNL